MATEIYTRSTQEKTFEEVRQDAIFAITEHNFRIINTIHIGQGIRQRGNTTFPLYDVILFCNLSLAEKMLSIDPMTIQHCPYKITISEYNHKVVVATKPIATANQNIVTLANKINQTIESIVSYAISNDLFIEIAH